MSIESHLGLIRNMQALRIGVTDFQTFGNTDLRFNDINTGHLLGDGMLDLNARIDFDEVEQTRICIHQEFDRACMCVINCTAQPHCGFA